jgi:hypothetical protein
MPHQIDELILLAASHQWRKVAMIVATTLHECERRQLNVSADEIGKRVELLVTEKRLDSQGNLSNWRHSEVRLPA